MKGAISAVETWIWGKNLAKFAGILPMLAQIFLVLLRYPRQLSLNRIQLARGEPD